MTAPLSPVEQDAELIERVARAMYERHPQEEGGEYVDGFQVSPGGKLTWVEACAIEAEFGDDLPAGHLVRECRLDARAALQALPRYGEALAAAIARADAAEDCIRRAHEAADAAGEPIAPYTDQEDITQFIEASMESWGILHEYEHAMYVRENGEREAATLARAALNNGEEE